MSWHAVGTTTSVDALINAPDFDVPVYNTQGILLATAATGIYNGTLLSPVQYDQFGSSETTQVWTGTQPDGGTAEGNQLGDYPIIGFSSDSTDSWIDGAITESNNRLLPIYALSSPITEGASVPEPATVTLLFSAFLVIGGIQVVGRRKLA